MRQLAVIGIVLTVLAAVMSCKRVPSHVIEPERMAVLLADIRMADAVISLNPKDYRSDSSRLILKQAVFEHNGVTEADFDTSLVWYGHNIGKFQEVNERTIEILEQRLTRVASIGDGKALSIAGDSVDVWPGAPVYVLNRRSPSRYITFAMENDRNWESGDFYRWTFKFITQPASARWNISAVYDDGTIETLTALITVGQARQTVTFNTDSTREARYISGWLYIEPDGHRPVYIDSVSLTRGRLGPGLPPRNFLQRTLSPADAAAQDTIR